MKQYFIEIHKTNAPGTRVRARFVETPFEEKDSQEGYRKDWYEYVSINTNLKKTKIPINGYLFSINFVDKEIYEHDTCHISETPAPGECLIRCLGGFPKPFVDASVASEEFLGTQITWSEHYNTWAVQIHGRYCPLDEIKDDILIFTSRKGYTDELSVTMPKSSTHFKIEDGELYYVYPYEEDDEQ